MLNSLRNALNAKLSFSKLITQPPKLNDTNNTTINLCSLCFEPNIVIDNVNIFPRPSFSMQSAALHLNPKSKFGRVGDSSGLRE